ncbi:type I restriction enzyme S subunit [Ereboglobus sp. PH5-10]|uniref:restriction endonuclease subunit S n=1 Tax=Ereboglobus sp. PH5-10 TaxID=2940629 RepID=UPI00240727E7|nr:restriction endonuclease subunit S [Ereboglobus sp. PH5-10]MDF9826369.1 type I restriction enzyme S subunit [Ereboglobus sp. PH5-10]
MKLPPYSKYKPSEISQLGDVPESWDVMRGRFVMKVNPPSPCLRKLKTEEEVSFVPMDAVGEYGGINLDQTRVIEDVSSGYTEFQNDDVIVAKITPCFENGKAALASGLLNGAAFGTTELHVLRADSKLNNKFLFYAVVSDSFRKLGESEMYGAGGQKRVPPEFAKNFPMQVPPLSEQHQIAAFLDWKTGQIDALIAKKQALLEKLKEKRLALITQAVTKGLNPNAPLKDSGIPWLGKVPQHWEVMSLHHVIRMKSGESITSSDIEEAGAYPVYGGNGIRGFFDKYTHDGHFVLIGRQGAHCGNINYASGKFWASEHAVVAKPDRKLYTIWLGETLRAMNLNQYSESAAQPGLSVEAIGRLKMPFPPYEEQIAIAKSITNETVLIDKLSVSTKQTIARLAEYRTALITAATTGKIDVRNVKIPAKQTP